MAKLKANLSAYLKQVKAGREVVVSERGIPIARLVPVEPAQLRRGHRQELAAAGLLRLGRGKVRRSLLTPPGAAESVDGVLEALLAERDEAR